MVVLVVLVLLVLVLVLVLVLLLLWLLLLWLVLLKQQKPPFHKLQAECFAAVPAVALAVCCSQSRDVQVVEVITAVARKEWSWHFSYESHVTQFATVLPDASSCKSWPRICPDGVQLGRAFVVINGLCIIEE